MLVGRVCTGGPGADRGTVLWPGELLRRVGRGQRRECAGDQEGVPQTGARAAPRLAQCRQGARAADQVHPRGHRVRDAEGRGHACRVQLFAGQPRPGVQTLLPLLPTQGAQRGRATGAGGRRVRHLRHPVLRLLAQVSPVTSKCHGNNV